MVWSLKRFQHACVGFWGSLSSWITDGCFVLIWPFLCVSQQRERASSLVSYQIMGPCKGVHLTLTTSLWPHFQIQALLGLRLQHMNFEGYKHLTQNKEWNFKWHQQMQSRKQSQLGKWWTFLSLLSPEETDYSNCDLEFQRGSQNGLWEEACYLLLWLFFLTLWLSTLSSHFYCWFYKKYQVKGLRKEQEQELSLIYNAFEGN